MLTVTPIYAGVLAVFFVFLSLRVAGSRRAGRIAVGDGDDRVMLRKIRVHGNCAEYAPFTLLLMGFAEIQGASGSLLHGVGIALIVGRFIHAIGLSQEPDILPLRASGMILTLGALLVGALTNLWFATPVSGLF